MPSSQWLQHVSGGYSHGVQAVCTPPHMDGTDLPRLGSSRIVRMDMDLAVRIGDHLVLLQEPHGYPCLTWPLRPFERFLAAGAEPELHVTVTVTLPLPEFSPGTIRFDAAHGRWILYEAGEALYFESLDPKTMQPRVRAWISSDFRSVRAWILPDLQHGQVGWSPMQLINPLVEVCLLSRIGRSGGLLLHAAGLSYGGQGYVFLGESGAGKSTIAELFAARGATVLSDERVILGTRGTELFMYGTPWVGSGNYAKNDSAPISNIFEISHGADRHVLAPLPPATYAARVLRQAILPYWDRLALDKTLGFVASLVSAVPCHTLAFLKSADIVEFIEAHSVHAPSIVR